jgi:hypothetical protein
MALRRQLDAVASSKGKNQQAIDPARKAWLPRLCLLAVGSSAAQEAASRSMAEVMAARDALAEKLRKTSARTQQLELERASVMEVLQDLPVEGVKLEQVGHLVACQSAGAAQA